MATEEWKPRANMGLLSYLAFTLGLWASVETVPEWVHNLFEPPDREDILPNDSVESVFKGRRLAFKIETRRVTSETGTYTERRYYVRKRQ